MHKPALFPKFVAAHACSLGEQIFLLGECHMLGLVAGPVDLLVEGRSRILGLTELIIYSC